MGMLRDLTAAAPTGTAADAGPLRDLVSTVVTSDGSVDAAERVMVEALYESVPQLRESDEYARPPMSSKKALLATLALVPDERLRKQLFVIAIDLALSSDGASEREDAFIDELRAALRLDEDFARTTIVTLSFKYARAN